MPRCTFLQFNVHRIAHYAKDLLFSSLIGSLWLLSMPSSAFAQSMAVLPDGRTLTNISGSLDCSADCEITGNSRSGDNLFHSFSRFNVLEGVTATFEDGGAANIFTFVADEASIINGTLGVTGAGNANFFLLNPNGIVFGPSAELATAGSFLASTAENILFSDDWQFGAVGTTPSPLLSISRPIGLQFGSSPGAIVNQSRSTPYVTSLGTPAFVGLQVPGGKTLAFLGGDILLEGGSLTADSGQVTVGSVAGRSQLSIAPDLSVGYEGATGFLDVSITQQGRVDASGNRGQVAIRSRHLSLSSGASIANFIVGLQQPGSITIETEESVTLDRSSILFPRSAGLVSEGVSLDIHTRQLRLENGSLILGATLGGIGNGGQVNINASESVEMFGAGVSSPNYIATSSINSVGRGGDIDIRTRRLALADGSRIESVAGGAGGGGDIVINAREQIDVKGASPASTASPAAILLSILGLTLAPTTNEPAVSGILATSGLAEVDSTGITGAGGSLTLDTGVLLVSDRAQVAVSSFGAGDSGDLEVTARSIQLDSGGQLAAAAPFSDGGDVRLRGLETLILKGGSQVSTSAGTGDGGNISIDADFVIADLLADSDIIARATDGRGGNIEVNTLGLYGIVPRRAIAGNRTNDIDASSDFGVSGETAINEVISQVDLAFTTLASRPVDTALTVTQRCGASGNRFVVTARGGLPITPAGVMEPQASMVDLGGDFTSASGADATLAATLGTEFALNNTEAESDRLVEAKEWRVNQSGEVVLSEHAGQNASVDLFSASDCTG